MKKFLIDVFRVIMWLTHLKSRELDHEGERDDTDVLQNSPFLRLWEFDFLSDRRRVDVISRLVIGIVTAVHCADFSTVRSLGIDHVYVRILCDAINCSALNEWKKNHF